MTCLFYPVLFVLYLSLNCRRNNLDYFTADNLQLQEAAAKNGEKD